MATEVEDTAPWVRDFDGKVVAVRPDHTLAEPSQKDTASPEALALADRVRPLDASVDDALRIQMDVMDALGTPPGTSVRPRLDMLPSDHVFVRLFAPSLSRVGARCWTVGDPAKLVAQEAAAADLVARVRELLPEHLGKPSAENIHALRRLLPEEYLREVWPQGVPVPLSPEPLRSSAQVTREADLRRVLADLGFAPSCLDMGWEWEVQAAHHKAEDGLFRLMGWHIRCSFRRPDTDTGSVGRGMGRWWLIETGTTVGGIVKTAWAASKMIVEHELHEGFLYRDARVFDPHADVDLLRQANRKAGT